MIKIHLLNNALSKIYSFIANSSRIEDIIILCIIFFFALLSYVIVRLYVIKIIHFWIKHSKTKWDDVLIEKKVFTPLAYIVPALIIYFGAGIFPEISQVTHRIIITFIFFLIILILDRVLSSVLTIYDIYPISKKRPIKGYIQIAKLSLYLLGLVLAISILIGKSPWIFLSGIGALTAVILFIFRDTILSFVASIQIITNDLVRLGDWIEMPKYGADGIVIDMALHTIKVQNWDKTVINIPIYKLIEESFKNWRGMQEAGGRRIKRALLIDKTSIKFLKDDEITRLENIQILKEYIKNKRKEIDEYNKEAGIDDSEPVNGRRMTNLGTFRAYIEAYLRTHPKIRQDMTFIVRHLAPTAEGLPLEIYVFTNDIRWANYESIQADIFDHLLAAIPHFKLRVFQRPTGHDLKTIASIAKEQQGE